MTSDKSNEKEIRKQQRRETLKNKLSGVFWKVKTVISNALFPEDLTCDACGEELTVDTRYRLCAECYAKLPTVGEHICLICGMPLKDEADYCIRCENQENEFSRNCSPLVYDGIAKELIHALKFGKKKYLAETLSAMMADEYLRRNLKTEIAVFVPMTVAEEKKRGFNQSELLARNVADRLNLPLLPALSKIKETSAQKELTGKERKENLDGAFVCTFNQVRGRRILLIDDVFTTGATANSCSKALLKGGARDVTVLTCAVTEKKIPYEKGVEN